MNTLKCALYYARLGWHVFPVHNPIFDARGVCTGCTCEHYRRSDECARNHPHIYLGPDGKCDNPGKCPRVRWGEKSTIDPETIRKWWGRPWRDVDVETGEVIENIPNIADDCGKSSILAFDADTYKNQVGDLLDIIPRGDQETVTALTGGGGTHLVYDAQGKPYGNSTHGLDPGIDIRGVGGYIVVAPSVHKSGRRYMWESGYEPGRIPLRPIPDALDAILSAAHGNRVRYTPGEPTAAPEAIKRQAGLVDQVIERAELAADAAQPYLGDGLRWILSQCPFCPESDRHADDGTPFIVVLPDGRIVAGCHHNRCRQRIAAAGVSGWQLLRKRAGMERQPFVRRQVIATVSAMAGAAL
ncbi:MAG: bifunctional DNA primase/polymerase [Caldilineaceae bacterium]|nr:bifunctional DNA primase/polymerase [Caldilineaceae bacterium]